MQYKQYDPETLRRVQEMQLDILKDIIRVCELHDIRWFIAYGSLLGTVRHQGPIPWDDDIDICMTREDFEKFSAVADEALDSQYELVSMARNLDYPMSLPKVQKKGTRFIDRTFIDAKFRMGVFVDIFVYDYVSDDAEEARKQAKKCNLLDKLMILQISKFPNQGRDGLAAELLTAVYLAGHYALQLIPRKWLFNAYKKEAQKYRGAPTKTMICLDELLGDRTKATVDELFPTVPLMYSGVTVQAPKEYDRLLTRQFGDYMQLPPVEKRVNHCPDILDLGEQGIIRG